MLRQSKSKQMKKNTIWSLVSLFVITLFTMVTISCNRNEPGLKDVFKDDFLIGTSMSTPQILGTDTKAQPFIVRQFNSVTAENAMKWEKIHPKPGIYNFAMADSMVTFAMKNNMFIAGHTLVWHSQTPDWVFQDSSGILCRVMHFLRG